MSGLYVDCIRGLYAETKQGTCWLIFGVNDKGWLVFDNSVMFFN
jgi:hypothetical protein